MNKTWTELTNPAFFWERTVPERLAGRQKCTCEKNSSRRGPRRVRQMKSGQFWRGKKKKKNQWGYLFHLAVWQLRCQLAGLHYKHSVIYKTATVVHLSDFTTGCCYRLMMCVSYSESWIMIRLLQPHILVICSRVSSFWCKARVF